MSDKGYPSIRPIGVLPVEDDVCWYYYYELPEGLLELEVFEDQSRYRRRVAAFITDMNVVRDLLSS